VLYHLKTIRCARYWYRAGSELVKNQDRPDPGSIPAATAIRPTSDTCLAMLLLVRSTCAGNQREERRHDSDSGSCERNRTAEGVASGAEGRSQVRPSNRIMNIWPHLFHSTKSSEGSQRRACAHDERNRISAKEEQAKSKKGQCYHDNRTIY